MCNCHISTDSLFVVIICLHGTTTESFRFFGIIDKNKCGPNIFVKVKKVIRGTLSFVFSKGIEPIT